MDPTEDQWAGSTCILCSRSNRPKTDKDPGMKDGKKWNVKLETKGRTVRQNIKSQKRVRYGIQLEGRVKETNRLR